MLLLMVWQSEDMGLRPTSEKFRAKESTIISVDANGD